MFAINRHYPLMQSLCSQAKCFQLGIDELRKRRSIAFNGQKWQFVDIGQNCLQLLIPGICRQFGFTVHGFVEDGL